MYGNLEDDFQLLKQASLAAGALALSYWKNVSGVRSKQDGSPVTEADLAVDAALTKQLREARPDYGWLSEESRASDSWHASTRVWVVDPIDGTRAFISGREDWTVAIALMENGSPILGVVYNPVRQQLFAAKSGAGAFCNDAPISPSRVCDLKGARIIAADGMLKRQIWREPWPELTSVPALSIAYRLTLVASGGIDAAFALTGKWIWDVAAGALIAKEAGAAVTDPYGKPLVFSDPTEKVKGYLASTPGLQPLLLPRMKQGAEALKSQMKDRR